MSCKIEKNQKNGKINKVLNQAGKPSKLFQQIFNTPTLTLNQAIDAYKNIYSEKLKSTVKFQILGEKGAQNLDQIEEATFRMDNLLVAKEMEQVGKTPLEIKYATGWERGADGKFRFETSDIVIKDPNMQIELGKEYNSKDILTGDSINAYPNVKLIFNLNGENFYSGDRNTIELDARGIAYPNVQGQGTLDTKRQEQIGSITTLSTMDTRIMEHEHIHFIQQQEGFSPGGSPDIIITQAAILSGITAEDSGDVQLEKVKDALSKATSQSDKNILNAAIDTILGDSGASKRAYENISGEIEARSVQERVNKPDILRKNSLILDELNVAPEDRIFLDGYFGTNASMSLNSPQKIEKEVLDKLKQNGLANNVYQLTTAELNNKLEELGIDAETRKQVIAWHGSPYSFDRFTTAAMGTGEGNQAFGWGLYFTDLESIARSYADVLGSKKITFNGVDVNGTDGWNEGKEAISVLTQDIDGYGFIRSIESIKKLSNKALTKYLPYLASEKVNINDKEYAQDRVDAAKYLLENIDSFKEEQGKNLYKVSLHKGKEAGEYTWLEWDRPINEKISRILEKNGIPTEINGKLRTGENVYLGLEQTFGQKEASLLLLEAGIDGIKYPAESISRGATSDTARGFNYVVFDENAITIEEQIKFQKQLAKNGINLTVNGFVHNNDVYLNSDLATNETLLHEYSHIFLDAIEKNRPELYKRGMDLIEEELNKEDSDIKSIIDFVKTNQSSLKGDALKAEILAELTGRRGSELLESLKAKKSGIFDWLLDIWNSVKDMLGLTSVTPEQLSQMTLGEYVNAISVDLMNNKNLTNNLENDETRFRNRTRWNSSRGNQTLEGAPIITTRENVTGADPELTYWAEEYARRNGIDYKRQSVYVEVDEQRAKRIAQAYEEMEHNPQDPEVKEAYQNLINQTVKQYEMLVEAGYQFYFFDETNDPYNGNPWAAMEELRTKKMMGSFATEAGFGSGATDLNVEDNPMLQDTGFEWGFGSIDGQKKRVLANDLFRCFTPETLVRTSEGFKEIQNIKVGDLVLTHEGRFKKVYETIKNPHKGKILNISTNASYNPIRVTPEHPFYVLKGNHGEQKNSMCTPYICDRKQPNGNVTPQEKYHSFDWVEAKDLKEKMWFPLTVDTQIKDIDFIEIPDKYYKGRTSIPQKIELTEDFLSFVGLYIAEGSGGTNRININLHKDEQYLIDLVDRFAKSIGYNVKSRIVGNGITLQINCKILKNWFAEWLGKGSTNKKIPNELLQLPSEKLKHIAYGIFSGDGKKKKNSIEQTSLTLALQLIEVGARLGLQPTANTINYSKNDNHSNTYTTHEFLKSEHNFKQKKYTWKILDKDCRNITKIDEEYYEGFVYNIEVEDDHSYVVENVPVHNCVHDAFGHGLEGSGFRARGEENAWQSHARLFTGSAVAAITSETRGQNSWLNYGKYGEQNQTAKVEDTIFADQKTGLMPEWTWQEGFDKGSEKDLRFQIIGEKGASRIEEYNNLLNQAKELEKQGKDYSQTGWYKSQDGWKYLSEEIIKDFKIENYKENEKLTLKEVIGNENKLFEAYPEMEGIFVVFYNRNAKNSEEFKALRDNERGEFTSDDKTIRINMLNSENQGGVEKIQYVLGHELSHGVARIERFSKGGTPTVVLDEALSILNIENNGKLGYLYEKVKNTDKSKLTKNQSKIVKDSLKTIEALLTGNTLIIENQYKHVAGEIDANIVAELVSTGKAVGSYSDLLSMYVNKENIDPESIYLISGGNVQFSLSKKPTQQTTVEEPQAKFNGYNTYSEALKNTTSNDTIKITIEDEVVAEVSADTSNNTINGSLNDLVKQTILKGERFLNPNGDIVHVTEGNSAAKKFINATIAENLLGRNNTIIDDNSNIILKEKQESVLNLSFDEINKKYKDVETSSAVIAGKLYAENMTPFGDSRVIDSAQEITPENVLQENLLNLLSQLGVKTVSLDRYKASYENRNGVPVTAVALADIANKVIAFSSGNFTQDALVEEVSHFISEALDQEAIKPLLDNIHKTNEWAEHAQHYFELYGDEAIVRKEIFGKVLSNAIQKGFRQEQTTMVGNSIISKLRAFFEQFLDSIYAMIKPQHTVDLQRFTNEVYRNLMANQLIDKLNKEQLEGNKLVMYQSSATINNETDVLAEKVKKALEYLENQDRKLDSISKTEIEDIKQLQDLDASLQIAKISKRHVDYLRKRNKAKLLSSEEYAVYTSTTTFLFNALTALRGAVSNKQAEQALSDTIEEITLLKQEVRINQEEIFNDLIDRIVVSPEQKAAVLESFRTLEKDTGWFYQQAGGAIHASNPAINILSAVISDMNVKAKLNFNDRKVSFLNIADKLGFDVNQLPEVLKKFKRGSYVFNAYDFDKAEDDLNEEKARLLNKMFTEEEKKEIGEITKETVKEKENEIIEKFKDLERVKNYKYQANQYRLRNQNILSLKQSEIDDRDDFIKKNGVEKDKPISSTALLLDAEFSKKRSNITRQAKKEGGFSQALKALMEELNRDRLFAKNPFDNTGELRPGLDFDKDGKLTIDVKEAEKESILVYELTKLDEYKAKSFKDNTGQAPTPTYFYSILESMDADERREFLELNANISFNNNFWDQFDSSTNQVEDEELAKQIALVSKKRSNILKAYKVFNNPSEVNYTAMNDITKTEVRELSEALETLYKEANSKSGKETEDKFFESVVNDAYKKEIRDYYTLSAKEDPTVDQVVEFARNHTTLDNKYKLDWARGVFKDFEGGRIKQLPKSLQGYNNAAEFAESKLLPYFKKIQPKGFDYEAELNNFLDNPTQGLNSQYLSITPSYIFLEQGENDRVNPEYMKRIENGEPLLNDKYANKEYLDYFGMSSIDAQPTKNLKEYELLKELVAFQEETILSAGMENKHNKYLLPQKEARGLRKIMGADVKGYLRDLTRNREDDSIYGQTVDQTKSERQGTFNELIVPRHGFYKIEETTDELLYSYMWMAQQSELTRQRIDALAEVESVRGALLNKQYGDKHGESTRTYKMFDDFVRANIYGQSETFHMDTTFFGLKKDKVNVATSIKTFQSNIRLSNLGFNILTPLTSLLQGTVNYVGEKVVGGRVDKDAARLARKLMPSMLTESANETFSLVGKGKLSMLNEFMGQGSAAQRFENSNYNTGVRALQRSAYITHSLADAPLAAKVLLTVLHDYRVVGDKIMNFKQFINSSDRVAREEKAVNKSVKELRKEWATYEKDAIFNYLEVVKDGKYGKYELKEIPGVDRTYAEKVLQQVRNAVTLAQQEVNSAIPSTDRTYMQRHALMSFLTLHKSWLVTSMTRRFKSRHQNLYSGLEEEGSYTGLGNFLKDFILDMKANGGVKNLRQSFIKVWGEAKKDKVRLESLKRAGFDIAMVNALGLIAILLKNAADDDDEKDNAMLQFSSYMGYRLASEVTSQSTGFPNEAYKFLESPTTGLSQIQNLLDIGDLASSDLVKNGKYRGYSTRAAWAFKTLPIFKETFKLTEMEKTRQTYELFNRSIQQPAFLVLTYSALEKDKEEEEQ